MAKFVLIYNGGSTPETEAEYANVIKAWTDWYTDLGNAVLDPGNPFTPTAKKVTRRGVISDGPVGTMASGYTILDASSLEAAAKLSQSCPILVDGGEISIYEAIDTMM